MRHKGSVSQVNKERDKAVPALFKKAKQLAEWPTYTMRLCEIAANLPVSRYYIEEETAAFYVAKRYYQGIRATFRSPYKQLLHDSLYDKVVELKATERFKDASIQAVVNVALTHEAPCIGLTPPSIYMLLPHKKYELKKRK